MDLVTFRHNPNSYHIRKIGWATDYRDELLLIKR